MNMYRPEDNQPPDSSGGRSWLTYVPFAALFLVVLVFAALGRLEQANTALATSLLLLEFWTKLKFS
ncbi:hypothetical protein [Streptomyces microflavus]|uniref:hypothetical protein n=1 Tax=Streptomyces microflavus TaxID=1919 RepID=UPI0033BFA94C